MFSWSSMRSSLAAPLIGLLCILLLPACSTVGNLYGDMTQPGIHRAIMNGDLKHFYVVYQEQANTPGNQPDGITPLERLFSREVQAEVPVQTRLTMLRELIQAKSLWTDETYRRLAYYGHPALMNLALERGLDPDQSPEYFGTRCPLILYALESVYAFDPESNDRIMALRRQAAVGTIKRLLQADASMTKACSGGLNDVLYRVEGRNMYDRMALFLKRDDNARRLVYIREVLDAMLNSGHFSRLEAQRADRRLVRLETANENRKSRVATAEARRRAREREEDDVMNRAFSRFLSGISQRAEDYREAQKPKYDPPSASDWDAYEAENGGAGANDTSTVWKVERPEKQDYPSDNSGDDSGNGVQRDTSQEPDWGEVEVINFDSCSGNDCKDAAAQTPSNVEEN